MQELLIASVSPQNLERGVLWFQENLASIKKARQTNLWWRTNSIFLEKDLVLKPGEFARALADMGYERSSAIMSRGTYAARGGVFEVWPVNTGMPFLVEFNGNVIFAIHERPPTEERIKPKPTLSSSIETLKEGSFVVHADHGIGIFRGFINGEERALRNTKKYESTNEHSRHSERSEESHSHSDNLGIAASRRFVGTRNDTSAISYIRTNSYFVAKPQVEFSRNFFVIEYAAPRLGGAPDLLYVPTDQKDRLTPYIGFHTPTIHRLGGTIWFKTKRKAREDAEKFARELLILYAGRRHAARPPHEGDPLLEKEVRAAFPFCETDDQLRAEEEIMRDLSSEKPMDRVLVGDVGFGKTELALRACVRVVASGRQAALLAPTTILAAQHEKTFRDRLEAFGVRVAGLSRLTPTKEIRSTLKDLADGSIDCVIGTHRLLSRDVSFRSLGLAVIDEEQRFGVKQKERFKELRRNTDALSLSATPIPRTLQFTLSHLRDVSQIQTPPPERLPIRTVVLPHSWRIIRDVIQSELTRGGQVYFLHNRIETIGMIKQRLEKLLIPKVSHDRNKSLVKGKKNITIGVMHGRTNEKELIKTMTRFRAEDINVLLATTIIENGLDISSANTLIVDDAARLGLAEAHQLRGRIGRGSKQAFAYFLYKPRHLTDKAADRLDALITYADLGAGYQLALRDLEIRGAGNILGREQSGTVNKVGLGLYYQMLGEAVDILQSENA